MWIEKLTRGVIELETAIGPRYLRPSLFQRVRFMWTFRNFLSLPIQVLTPSEIRLINRLANDGLFLSQAAMHDYPIIGKIERRTPAALETLAPRKPVASAEERRRREAASA